MNGDRRQDEWPFNPKTGRYKLILSDGQANRFIAAGLLTEEDVIRTKPIPLSTRPAPVAATETRAG